MISVMTRAGFAALMLLGAHLAVRADPADLAAGADAVQQGRWDEAIGLMSQALAVPGRSKAEVASAHSQRGYAYFAKGHVDQAIVDYNAALKLDARDGHVYALRGWAHFIKGDMKQAIADSTNAIKLDPGSAVAYRNRGRAELYSGKAKNAADDFAAAVRLAPSDTLGVLWLHVARARTGGNDMDEFRRNIDRLDRKEWPGPLVEPLTGGMTPERVGDIAMSAKGEKTQLERRCDAQVYFGLLQGAAGDRSEAASLFRAALQDCPPGVAQTTEVAVAKLELKALGEGSAIGRGTAGAPTSAMRQPPAPDAAGDARNHTMRALAHFTNGEMNRAIADSTAALRVASDSAAAYRIRGLAQLYSGRAKAAADDFASAVRLDPADVLGTIWLHVARVRSGSQDAQEFRANIGRVDRRVWPGPLADVLTGASTPEQVGDIAMANSGDKSKMERVCDAQVYLGLLQLAAGDKNEAGKLFRAAVADCPTAGSQAIEPTVAKLELKRLGGGPAGERKPTPSTQRNPPRQTGGSS